MPKTLRSLRSLKIKDIDLEEARRHFDLPVEEQFSSRRDLLSGLTATRDQLISLFKGSDTIPVWRGMDCDSEWAANVQPGDDLGECWAWQESGAVKGAGLSSSHSSGVLLFGEIDETDVDWATTVAVNTFHEDECEIVLYDGSAVHLKTIFGWPTRDVLLDWGDGEPGSPSP